MKGCTSPRNADTFNICYNGRIPCVNLSIGIWDEHEKYDKLNLRQVFRALGFVHSCLENHGKLTESLSKDIVEKWLLLIEEEISQIKGK